MNRMTKPLLVFLLFLGGALCLFRLAQPSRTAGVFARYGTRTLILDAGHGGEDGGAVSASGQPESGINLSIVLKLDQMAGLYGVHTLLTRSADRSVADGNAGTIREKKRSDLHNRTALVNETPGAVLLSVHQNKHPQPSARGAQVFYRDDPASQRWARTTQAVLVHILGKQSVRRAEKIPGRVYLMNHVNCRAILVECGFLSNPEEDRLLQSEAYQSRLAAALLSAFLTGEAEPEGNR